MISNFFENIKHCSTMGLNNETGWISDRNSHKTSILQYFKQFIWCLKFYLLLRFHNHAACIELSNRLSTFGFLHLRQKAYKILPIFIWHNNGLLVIILTSQRAKLLKHVTFTVYRLFCHSHKNNIVHPHKTDNESKYSLEFIKNKL